MKKYLVNNAGPLHGEVTISGSKNAALPILAASILPKGTSMLLNVPALSDVEVMCQILEDAGAIVTREYDAGRITIDANHKMSTEVDRGLCGKMRASNLLLGALLAKEGRARVPISGGCEIGKRPIDLHEKGFEALGAIVQKESDAVTVCVDGRLKGADIYLDYPSVGATENI